MRTHTHTHLYVKHKAPKCVNTTHVYIYEAYIVGGEYRLRIRGKGWGERERGFVTWPWQAIPYYFHYSIL